MCRHLVEAQHKHQGEPQDKGDFWAHDDAQRLVDEQPLIGDHHTPAAGHVSEAGAQHELHGAHEDHSHFVSGMQHKPHVEQAEHRSSPVIAEAGEQHGLHDMHEEQRASHLHPHAPEHQQPYGEHKDRASPGIASAGGKHKPHVEHVEHKGSHGYPETDMGTHHQHHGMHEEHGHHEKHGPHEPNHLSASALGQHQIYEYQRPSYIHASVLGHQSAHLDHEQEHVSQYNAGGAAQDKPNILHEEHRPSHVLHHDAQAGELHKAAHTDANKYPHAYTVHSHPSIEAGGQHKPHGHHEEHEALHSHSGAEAEGHYKPHAGHEVHGGYEEQEGSPHHPGRESILHFRLRKFFHLGMESY